MTELHDLLERAAGPHVSPDASDIAGDVARGMRALRRRRTGAAGGILTAAVAAAAIPVAVGGGWPSASGGPVAPGGSGAKSSSAASDPRPLTTEQQKKQAAAAQVAAQDAAKKAAEKVALAAAAHTWRADGAAVPIHTYAGPALAGSYQPALLPEDAVVQGGNAYRLTIARADDPDTNPDSFVGKIVVMLSGRAPVGTPRIVESDDFSRIVVVPLSKPIDGAMMFEVQFSPGLAWTDDEAVKFASSIDVLPSAKSAKG
jgi:hypothetical protein